MSITKKPFGCLPGGQCVSLYSLRNASGFEVCISDFGGTVVRILAPDRRGFLTNVACGFDDLASYQASGGYLGATVGRVCNRIAKGQFVLDGTVYDQLYINDGPNSLHGGKVGYSHRLWQVVDTQDGETPSLTLALMSPDGDEGYPGQLEVRVTYTVTPDNRFCIHYLATSDKATPVNLTNHVYFNLGGVASGDVLDQVVWLDAESYLRTDETLIPTGEMVPVRGTAFDFTTPKPIGQDIACGDANIEMAGGYDHCFNFTEWENKASTVRLRGTVCDPTTGRKLEMYTNSPCVQFYTANFLHDADYPLTGGYPQQTQHGFCLETQKMPDAVHHAHFTDTILCPGEVFDFTTVYAFTTV